ncbi:uncharacterized protein LOC105186699 [Harpegnathos saltator]|uniref:uncharacterized protein LOC105186699 n=1 Tax=Harpegnathos saltator TaxID=610380 RepID=UPI000DBEDED6|nr:uncharacterized protein LOC105186699 [Harpegnathos saltator]
MEVMSQDLMEQYYEIQEIEEIPRRNESSFAENSNRDAVENAAYFARRDLPSSSTLAGRIREVLDDETEVILLLQEEGSARCRREYTTNQQIIELSDNDCKLALRRQLQMADGVKREDAIMSHDDENAEMLRKLPPDTIVMRQEQARPNKAENNSDYKELTTTETNSSSSGGGRSGSSTSGCTAAKVKRIPRAVRHKTHETVEVRRNPMRSKKDVNKDLLRPRQRLLTNRREVCETYEAGKRTRSSAVPYMNTRSVTRKMYAVGATYQAPTKRDETEWKEWPAHGMHERPVYHPQAGLAVEYLGRYFVSFDGLSYCEIMNESDVDVEVVAVDPRYDRRPSSAEKKPMGKVKVQSKRSSNTRNTWNTALSAKMNESFGTCMHGSFHCVLGYCSQVMTPFYRQMTGERPIMKLATPVATKTNISESMESTTTFKDKTLNIMKNSDNFAEETKLLEDYAIAMAQNTQSKNSTNSRDRIGVATVTSSSAVYVSSDSQKSIMEIDGSKTVPSSRTNLLRSFPNSSLVLLTSSGTKNSGEVCKTKDMKDTYNSAKLEDSSSEETLSSIYKKLISVDKTVANREVPPAKGSFYTLKRQHSTSGTREYNPKKIVFDAQLENIRSLPLAKENNENGNNNSTKIKQPDSGVFAGPNVKNRSWCTSETSEIARILSEYNRGAIRKSAIHIYGNASKNDKTSLATSGTKYSTKVNCFWQQDTMMEENCDVSESRNMGLDLSQGKWKKLATLENTSDQMQHIVDNDRNTFNRFEGYSTPVKSYPGVSPRDRHTNLDVANYARKEPAVAHKDLGKQPRETLAIDVKPKKVISKCSKEETEVLKTEDSLRELLENTAVLYCAANGVHQDDLSSYIDTLDSKQSIQWLETYNNSIT